MNILLTPGILIVLVSWVVCLLVVLAEIIFKRQRSDIYVAPLIITILYGMFKFFHQ